MKAFVGLGANLGDARGTLHSAVKLLDRQPGVTVVAVSAFRETEPVGYVDQPPFVNGACLVETTLSAAELLACLQAVENELGRVREGVPRWGPRTCDLDLLLFGDDTVDTADLVVPHPRLAERRFALEPLLDIDPALRLPGGRLVADLLAGL